jgi:hypothetical protein
MQTFSSPKGGIPAAVLPIPLCIRLRQLAPPPLQARAPADLGKEGGQRTPWPPPREPAQSWPPPRSSNPPPWPRWPVCYCGAAREGGSRQVEKGPTVAGVRRGAGEWRRGSPSPGRRDARHWRRSRRHRRSQGGGCSPSGRVGGRRVGMLAVRGRRRTELAPAAGAAARLRGDGRARPSSRGRICAAGGR